MAGSHVLGSRIRERRLDQGLRQAEVAASVGISASYLNLIEHNKRRIGGKLLAQLADVLSIDTTSLTSGGDTLTLEGMRAAAVRLPDMADIDRAEDLAARYPAWARLIAAQEMRIDTLETEVQALSDRMAHDPALASALHNVISSVTSIRATADILVSGERVDADWQSRFHDNIHTDSQKLAVESKALVSYLDQSKAAGPVDVGVSVFDQVDHFLAATPDLFTAIDRRPDAAPDAILAAYDTEGLTANARALLLTRIAQFAADAAALPIKPFREIAVRHGGEPGPIAAHFGIALAPVMRRLAYMKPHKDLPPMGLATCDAAGALTMLKAVPGFGLHRRSDPCPLWPLFSALVQPGQPLRRIVALADPSATRLLCYATATLTPAQSFDGPPVIESTMLVVADPAPGAEALIEAGTTCRICPRPSCPARREPSVLTGAVGA